MVRQVRLCGQSRATVVFLLRWAYGEAVPSFKDDLSEAFELLEACQTFEVERLETLLRATRSRS